MITEGPRYESFSDPLDFWLVWDKAKEEPACLDRQVLMGLSKNEAEMFCELMNDLHFRLAKHRAKAAA